MTGSSNNCTNSCVETATAVVCAGFHTRVDGRRQHSSPGVFNPQAAAAQGRVLRLHLLHALLAGRVHGVWVAVPGVRAAGVRARVPRLLPLQRPVDHLL